MTTDELTWKLSTNVEELASHLFNHFSLRFIVHRWAIESMGMILCFEINFNT